MATSAPARASVPLVKPGLFHRLALAVHDTPAADAWLRRVFGAAPVSSPMRPHQDVLAESNVSDMEGAVTQMLWHGGLPLILLGGGVAGGPIATHIEKFGPSVHSLAWEVDDMWTVEHRLREHGIRIAAVNIPGRHFFMHPRDTHSVLMEWTDTTIGGDPRSGAGPTGEGGGIVAIAGLAWVTAVVSDASATAAFLEELAAGERVDGNPSGPADVEETIDMRVGDVTIRLVTPRGPRSRFHAVLAKGPRLWSYALWVPDLDAAVGALHGEGIATVFRDERSVVTEPSQTLGVPIELVGKG